MTIVFGNIFFRGYIKSRVTMVFRGKIRKCNTSQYLFIITV